MAFRRFRPGEPYLSYILMPLRALSCYKTGRLLTYSNSPKSDEKMAARTKFITKNYTLAKTSISKNTRSGDNSVPIPFVD